ncbi:MAG: hypothetical protein FJ278_21510, partial [Planctomycetes bacterium]|nr:hypothetical protein [Planctomycetota bacterium]
MASARSALAVPPTVLWASDPALPGEVVLVHGEGWGDRATVELTALANDPAGKPGGASISIAPLDTRG